MPPLALSLAALGLAAAAPSFAIDASSPIATFLNLPLLDCVGTGHASLALRADYQAHLRAVQRDIGFKRIRGHGLLDDDMSVLLDGKANFFNVFSAFDFYLSVGIKPLVELSFMPNALAYDASKTIMHYKGGTSAPKSFSAWGAFIEDVVRGLVDRYGADEVRSWRFEVWSERRAKGRARASAGARAARARTRSPPPAPPDEPNGCGFYCPPPGVANIDSYFELYNATSRAIKAVDAALSVGGPATAGLAWVGDFAARTGAGALMPASFISTHSYPTDYRHNQTLNRTIFEDGVIAAAEVAEAAGLPFVLTEMSAGLNNAYDSYFAAAFIVHQAAAFLGVANVPTMSFWVSLRAPAPRSAERRVRRRARERAAAQ